MARELKPDAAILAHYQAGILRREQLIGAGYSSSGIQRRVAAGDWRYLGRGLYATFTGKPPRDAKLWTALLRAGPGALLSHETAAELHGFAEEPCPKIHLTVPISRELPRYPGLVIHRARVMRPDTIQAPWYLPRTDAADTVLDLASAAKTFDSAYAWVCDALGYQKTTLVLLRRALAARRRIRWRVWLTEAFAEREDGINSALERRYARDVERAHGLPAATRQLKRRTDSGTFYLDNLYEPYQFCVELDGAATHPHGKRWKDAKRDNINLATSNTRTMRLGWVAVTEETCFTAYLVARTLRNNGWPDQIHPCDPRCTAVRP